MFRYASAGSTTERKRLIKPAMGIMGPKTNCSRNYYTTFQNKLFTQHG